MGLPIVTVASGGLPVVDVGASLRGTPVTEATNGVGLRVTKVAAYGMPVAYETIGVAAPIVAAAFDVATKSANVALTNSNLTATHTNTTGGDGARVVPAVAAGKFYFEIKSVLSRGQFDGMGVLPAATSYATFGTAGVGNGVTVQRGGSIQINGVNMGSLLGTFAANDVLGVAIDLTGHLVWCRRNTGSWNGSGTADPATGTGGFTIPATAVAPGIAFAGTGTAINDAFTANFGASAFAGAVPSGFTAGWPA